MRPLGNPCDTHSWAQADSFDLDVNAPAGISVATAGTPSSPERTICADATTAVFTDRRVGYSYAKGGEWGQGMLLLSTELAVVVTAAADPPGPIVAGQRVHLTGSASGGVPPYQYRWSGGPLSSGTDSSTTATPDATTSYALLVKDQQGNQGSATVVVEVGMADPQIPMPIATPADTTTYTVQVTDSQGSARAAQVTVVVHQDLAVVASATPQSVQAGTPTTLLATITGGTPPYLNTSCATTSGSCAGQSEHAARPHADDAGVLVVRSPGRDARLQVTDSGGLANSVALLPPPRP